MKEKLIYVTIATLMALACSVQVAAEPLSKPKNDPQPSSSASSAAETGKEKTVQYAPPILLATSMGRTVTNADVAAIIAKEPRAFYSIPGDNHDGTLKEKRKGMDFRIRIRQPFEFFPNDVDRLIWGYCKFDENGKLREYDAVKGTFWGEEAEKMFGNSVLCYDSWTIAWFDKNETEYMHLDEIRGQLEIAHPPKSEISYIKKVFKALYGKESVWIITPDSHIIGGGEVTGFLGDRTTCARCGRKFTDAFSRK